MFKYFKSLFTKFMFNLGLSKSELAILDAMDNYLVDKSITPLMTSQIKLASITLSLWDQAMPQATLIRRILALLPVGAEYIPRSIAYVNNQGDVSYIYSVYETGANESDTAKVLFFNALTQTNAVRALNLATTAE